MKNIFINISTLLVLSVTNLAAQETNSIARPALRLEMATTFGGKSEDRVHGMTVDVHNNIIVTAPIQSKDFPTTPDALNRTATGTYLARLDPAGTLLYSTFLGVPGGANYAHGVAIDKEGCIYIAGNTTNPNFPTTPGAFQTTCKGPTDSKAAHGDAYVVKLSPTCDKIIYSTFLGGSGPDICGKIAVDMEGNAYIIGSTSSKDFPVIPGAFQTSYQGMDSTGHADIFIAKLSPDGSRLIYCTYLGGTGTDFYGNDIVVDAAGCVYVSGMTVSKDFPTTANALSRSFHGGKNDGFLAKLKPDGSALEYASYIGGSGDDYVRSIAIDNMGNVWITGETGSIDFPVTPDAYLRQHGGGTDGFFAMLNLRDGKLFYSSLLGGGKSVGGMMITIHPSGLLVLAGYTESVDFPVTPDALSTKHKAEADLFIKLFDPVKRSFKYATLFGGNGNDVLSALLCRKDSIYLAGNSTSTDFPVTTGASFQGGKNPWGGDAFVLRFTLTEHTNSKIGKK